MDAYARMVRGLPDAGVPKEDVRRLIADNPALRVSSGIGLVP
ncbi:hypothetical protein [Sinomonas sp. R1AF57]|nr:hypothetical protein [Sinomonas sp. R1AF57]